MMIPNKIAPCIWLNADGGRMSAALDYYQKVFKGEFEPGPIIPLGETPGGYAEMAHVKIFGQAFSFMNTERVHATLNDSVSFCITCEDQEEIDMYWDYFTRDGAESQCGWCLDKYGVRWQVLPKNLGDLMRQPGAGEVMSSQKRIVIAEYQK